MWTLNTSIKKLLKIIQKKYLKNILFFRSGFYFTRIMMIQEKALKGSGHLCSSLLFPPASGLPLKDTLY